MGIVLAALLTLSAADHAESHAGALTEQRAPVPPVAEGAVVRAWTNGMLGILLGYGLSIGGTTAVLRGVDTDALFIIGTAFSVLLAPATSAFAIDAQLNDDHSTFSFTAVIAAGVGTYSVIIGTALYFALASLLPISPVVIVLAAAGAATAITPAVQVLVGLMTREWKPEPAAPPSEAPAVSMVSFSF